ncbi:MAG: alpha/beta hydrolase [Hymenobacter sp.]|nr:alpha/beta hydrolase [Hymenobacter sp.]
MTAAEGRLEEDLRQWAPQVAVWRRHFRVLNCDMRKHGLTQDGDSTFVNAVGLARVLDSLGVRQTHVVGLSLGAVAALDFVLTYPDRVTKLVLASPGLIGFDLNHDSVLVANSRRQVAAQQRHDTLAYAENFVRSWVDGPRRQPAQTPAATRQLAQRMVRDNLHHHQWATSLNFGYSPLPRQRLPEVQTPTLVLTGTLDMQDILSIGDELTQKMPHVRRVSIPGAAHLLNLEQPHRFTAEVQKFLLEKRNPGR